MSDYIVKIISVESITHDVKRFSIEKPAGYQFKQGQATFVSINKPEWVNEKRPFTFTGLNSSENLEFTIKIYEEHNGVTKELGKLKAGEELVIRDVWGAIEYKGEGVFIAGGAGITPFIAILRQLHNDHKINHNKLIFSNKTTADIILQSEFNEMLGVNFINTITEEKNNNYENRIIDYAFLKEKVTDFSCHFYVCGPPPFVEAITKALGKLGAETNAVVFEK